MQFSILGSSSSGNSGLLVTENSKILVDAGFSCRRLCGLLEDRGVSPEEIDAIFVTHEHSDHIAGISTFTKKYGTAVYANLMTAKAVQPKLKHRPEWRIFNTGASFEFRDITVETFSLPHDAHDPVAFKFSNGRGNDLFSPTRKLAWLTDLGFAPRHIGERIKDVDTLVIESNYCPRLLERDDKRPWAIKQRISGRHGHLSNLAALELLQSVSDPAWSQVFLAHLSRDCNSPDAIQQTFSSLREDVGYRIDTVEAGDGTRLLPV